MTSLSALLEDVLTSILDESSLHQFIIGILVFDDRVGSSKEVEVGLSRSLAVEFGSVVGMSQDPFADERNELIVHRLEANKMISSLSIQGGGTIMIHSSSFWWRALVASIIFLLVGVGVPGWALYDYYETRSFNQNATPVNGSVVKTEVETIICPFRTTWGDGVGCLIGEIELNYTVEGHDYKVSFWGCGDHFKDAVWKCLSKHYPLGGKVPLYYDRRDPDDGRPELETPGLSFSFVWFGIFLALYTGYLIFELIYCSIKRKPTDEVGEQLLP
jgi:hypothetical protein